MLQPWLQAAEETQKHQDDTFAAPGDRWVRRQPENRQSECKPNKRGQSKHSEREEAYIPTGATQRTTIQTMRH